MHWPFKQRRPDEETDGSDTGAGAAPFDEDGSTAGAVDAEAAKRSSEETLRQTKGRSAEVHEIAERLRKRHETNHVAEAVTRLLEGGNR